MTSIFEPTAEQLEALAANETLQREGCQISYLIEHTRGDVKPLLARQRENLEQIKKLNLRSLCGSLVPRR